MNNVIVIPARYASTRLPGKPLMLIGDKPMIWWVYEKCKKVDGVKRIVVATDSETIERKCHELGMDVIMTSKKHDNHVSRIAEVSHTIKADYYICVNGDEPLIDSNNIKAVIPDAVSNTLYAGYCIRPLTNISEATDTSNIKVVRKTRLMLHTKTEIYRLKTIIPLSILYGFAYVYSGCSRIDRYSEGLREIVGRACGNVAERHSLVFVNRQQSVYGFVKSSVSAAADYKIVAVLLRVAGKLSAVASVLGDGSSNDEFVIAEYIDNIEQLVAHLKSSCDRIYYEKYFFHDISCDLSLCYALY